MKDLSQAEVGQLLLLLQGETSTFVSLLALHCPACVGGLHIGWFDNKIMTLVWLAFQALLWAENLTWASFSKA